MRKYVRTCEVIRFASKQNIIGTEGSGSVSGYWTIWQTRKTANGWSQPHPVRVNLSDDDIRRYRGVLWNWEEGRYDTFLRSVEPILCPTCGEMRLSLTAFNTLHMANCWRCNMLIEEGEKHEEV